MKVSEYVIIKTDLRNIMYKLESVKKRGYNTPHVKQAIESLSLLKCELDDMDLKELEN